MLLYRDAYGAPATSLHFRRELVPLPAPLADDAELPLRLLRCRFFLLFFSRLCDFLDRLGERRLEDAEGSGISGTSSTSESSSLRFCASRWSCKRGTASARGAQPAQSPTRVPLRSA